MNLSLKRRLKGYKSESQKIRVLSERWVSLNIFCPNCSAAHLEAHPNNKPVADFFCGKCGEDYELKSKKGCIGRKIVDGGYSTMIRRVLSVTNPNLFVLSYDDKYNVTDLCVIPKHFFVSRIIEKRKPLSPKAKRAGWVGCNIAFHSIPETGKISLILKGKAVPRRKVIKQWKKTLFLQKRKPTMQFRGWLLDIMYCVDKINKDTFSLDDVYAYEAYLKERHPQNKHVKDKIRQQLQILRDKGYLAFKEKGLYQRLKW